MYLWSLSTFSISRYTRHPTVPITTNIWKSISHHQCLWDHYPYFQYLITPWPTRPRTTYICLIIIFWNIQKHPKKSAPPHLWCLWDQQFHIIHVLNISLPTTLPHSEQLLIVWSLYSFTLIKNGWWAKNGSLNIDTAWAAEKDVGLNEVGSHHPLTRDEHDFRKIAKKIIKKWPKKLMTTPTMPWAAQKDVGLTGWQCLTTTALSAAQRKSFPAIFVLLLVVRMIKEDQAREGNTVRNEGRRRKKRLGWKSTKIFPAR